MPTAGADDHAAAVMMFADLLNSCVSVPTLGTGEPCAIQVALAEVDPRADAG